MKRHAPVFLFASACFILLYVVIVQTEIADQYRHSSEKWKALAEETATNLEKSTAMLNRTTGNLEWCLSEIKGTPKN